MAANQARCYADLGNDELCMEIVAELGHRCAAHTWVEPPPIQRIPIRILNPEVPVPEPVEPERPLRRREPPPDHLRCVGIKRNGERCACKRKLGSDRCGTHQAAARPVEACTGIGANGDRCIKPGKFNGLCAVHNRRRIQNEIYASNLAWEPFDSTELRDIINVKKMEQRVRLHRLNVMHRQMALALTPDLVVEYNNLTMEYNAIRTQFPRLRTAVNRNLARLPAEPLVGSLEEIAARARQRVEAVIHDFEEADGLRRRLMDLRVGNVQRDNPLAAFANDRQNVHTTETNAMVRNVNIRLQDVSPTADPLREIAWEWNSASLGTPQQRHNVRADMTHWYNEPSVSTLNDFAYKNMLDRVWGLINASGHRADMIVRLWEECVDAVGMCAAGHLTRLANAVQGFDESAAPVLEESRSERLQTAMSQISELEPAEREQAARRIFAELGVEGDAQRPWLEALEVV